MSTTAIVIAVLVVLALIVIGIAIVLATRGGRSRSLRSRFGPEYDRVVGETGSRADAESQLQQRVEERNELPIRDLSSEERTRYATAWTAIQQRFVDDPTGAVAEADDLCTSLMGARGYPTQDFERQAAMISVDHADVVPAYRRAHELAGTVATSPARTDDLRESMVQYRALFERLLGEPVGQAADGGGWRPRVQDEETR